MATVSPSQPWSYILELPRDARAPGIARVTLRAVLESYGMPELIERAQLLTCELVTNAYLHTAGPCSMRLHGWDGERLRVSVWDTSSVVPSLFGGAGHHGPGPGAEAGRGLLFVQLFADSWGSRTYDKRRFGKTLWFELKPPRHKAVASRRRPSSSPVGCTTCAELEADRRLAAAGDDKVRTEDATVAVRSHFRDAHLLPQGKTW